MATVNIKSDVLNLRYYSKGSSQSNYRIQCIITEQEGLKSDCHLSLWLQERLDHHTSLYHLVFL